MAANKVWGLGENMCRNDFVRRLLFKHLIQSVMAYGVELWKEREELEKIWMDYGRWIFRLDFCMPGYMITRELNISRLRVGWGIRARRYKGK